MATRSTRKTSARRTAPGASPGADGPASQAEQLSRSLSESAQQIWLAGLGAFNRAQAEGTRLFEGLVRDGLGLEQQARRVAGMQAEAARRNVESTVGAARERAGETWERLEKGFEDRVHRTLVRLGVPDRDDLADLSRRVDALTAELRRHGVAATPKASRRPATRTTVIRPPAKKAVAKKAGAKKATSTRKHAGRATAPRASVPASPARAATTRRTRG